MDWKVFCTEVRRRAFVGKMHRGKVFAGGLLEGYWGGECLDEELPGMVFLWGVCAVVAGTVG